MSIDTPKTIAEVEQIAAKWGIELTTDDYAAAQAVIDQRAAEIQSHAEVKGGQAWTDKFNRWYPQFLKALHGFGDVSIMLAQTILVGPGILLVLIMLLIVEQQRVFHGVALFEVYEELAAFSATALVILNLSLELLISYVEHRAGYTEPVRHEFSLRLLAQRLAYIAGGNVNWAARPKSPAVRFKGVLRIVTFSIIVLALAGSMKSVIEKAQGNWTAAIRVVLVDSTLLEMVTWAGGLLFAVAAVLSAQALSQYAARKAIEIAAILASAGDDKSQRALAAAGMSGAAVLYARLKERQIARRRAGAVGVASAADWPSEGVLPVSEISETTEKPLTPGVRRAVEWIQAHPEHDALTLSQLEELSSISRATLGRARQHLRGQK